MSEQMDGQMNERVARTFSNNSQTASHGSCHREQCRWKQRHSPSHYSVFPTPKVQCGYAQADLCIESPLPTTEANPIGSNMIYQVVYRKVQKVPTSLVVVL